MAKKPANVRKGKARPAKEADEGGAEFEVEDETPVAAKPPMGLESALIGVTLVALVAAMVLLQLKLHASFGKGWPI